MIRIVLILLLFVIPSCIIFGIPFWVKQRRRRQRQRPFPYHWITILQRNLPFYNQIPKPLQRRIQDHCQVLIAEKQFIGCRGLQITDEIKVTIAAQAALLLLNEQGRYFSRLASILVYPNAYVVKATESVDDYVVTEYQSARVGESSRFRDQVVLSWADVQQGMKNWQDGQNVVLHEFAHQLDQENGGANGVPLLQHRADYNRWSAVMNQAYAHLQHSVEKGRKTVMDPYGALNPAEFFAVATETFFEKSRQLKAHYPELYSMLQKYYAIDPVAIL